MAKLDSSKRATLPDSAFAYVDSRGRRRLPIHDEAHVRNALARFTQVKFENDAARERARKRLLKAAKKYGIVPIGFIAGQLRSEKERAQEEARAFDVDSMPAGFVTFLMTDIEGSTSLLHGLGDQYAVVLNEVRDVIRAAVSKAGGHEVDAHADEFFAAFERAADAIEAAAAMQRALADRVWPADARVLVRVGIHSGEPTVTKTGYIGLPVHAAARVCAAAHGGQIIITGQTSSAVAGSLTAGVELRCLGSHRLRGLPDAEVLFQVEAEGLPRTFPPPRTGASRSS